MRFCRWAQKKRVKRSGKNTHTKHTASKGNQYMLIGCIYEWSSELREPLILWLDICFCFHAFFFLSFFLYLTHHSLCPFEIYICTVLTLAISFMWMYFFNVCLEPKMSLIKKIKANKSNWWKQQKQRFHGVCVCVFVFARDVRYVCIERYRKHWDGDDWKQSTWCLASLSRVWTWNLNKFCMPIQYVLEQKLQ